jgi:hypothetical protein
MTTHTIIGRRWFQKTYGNTYNTAQIIVDGETVEITPRQYGYGDHYLTIAAEALERRGLLALRHYENGGFEPLWQWAEANGVKFTYSTIDVARQKDL